VQSLLCSFSFLLCSSICEKCTNIHSEVNKGGHGALIAGSGLVDQTLNYLCVLPGLHNFHLCLDGFHHRHILHRKPTNIARFLCSTTFVYPSYNLISESTLLSSYPRLSFVARLMCFIYQFVDSYIPCCFIYTSNSNCKLFWNPNSSESCPPRKGSPHPPCTVILAAQHKLQGRWLAGKPLRLQTKFIRLVCSKKARTNAQSSNTLSKINTGKRLISNRHGQRYLYCNY